MNIFKRFLKKDNTTDNLDQEQDGNESELGEQNIFGHTNPPEFLGPNGIGKLFPVKDKVEKTLNNDDK